MTDNLLQLLNKQCSNRGSSNKDDIAISEINLQTVNLRDRDNHVSLYSVSSVNITVTLKHYDYYILLETIAFKLSANGCLQTVFSNCARPLESKKVSMSNKHLLHNHSGN